MSTNLLQRLEEAEKRLQVLEKQRNNPVERVKQDLLRRGVYTARFYTVPADYYDRSLDERALLLNGNRTQLCKSIIFENTASDLTDCSDPTNSKYYCVIIQYIAKIDTTMLRNLIHGLRKPEDRLSKQKFHFRLTTDETSLELTGFGHNAISPFGFTGPFPNIPIVICNRCLEVKPPLLYLGGGEVDVKVLLPLSDLLKATNAIVGLITEPRTDI